MDKKIKIMSIVVLSIMLIASLLLTGQKYYYDRRIAGIQNEMAAKDITIEVVKGNFEKLMQQHGRLGKDIDTTNKQAQELLRRLEKTDQKLLSVTNATIGLQKEVANLSGIINTTIPTGGWSFPLKKDSGYLTLDGKCSTGPTADNKTNCELTLGMKPVKLTQVVSQREDGTWAVNAVVPPGVNLEFGDVAVNPSVLKTSWYRKFNFSLLAAANKSDGVGGIGLGYRLGSFNISAVGLGGTAGDSHVYVGGLVNWFPWEK